jgi:Zn-dependent protease
MNELDIIKIVASVLALMIAIIGHEIMHGWVAYKYGDNTAKDRGRLSINPIKHVDPIGTILVPALLFMANTPFLFGWAKPVPIDMKTVIQNGGYSAAMQVSLAGIAYNIVMASLASAVFLSMAMPTSPDDLLYLFSYVLLSKIIMINVVLAVFNLWPIPQFDGSHFLSYLGLQMGTPKIAQFYDRYQAFGMIIVLIILMIPQLSQILFAPASWLFNLLLT